MKKKNKLIMTIAAVLLAVVALGAYILLQQDEASNTNIANLQIQDGRITPASITIPLDSPITVVNNDEQVHTIVSEHPGFGIKDLQPGQRYSYVFNQTGEWKFGLEDSPFGMEAVVAVK